MYQYYSSDIYSIGSFYLQFQIYLYTLLYLYTFQQMKQMKVCILIKSEGTILLVGGFLLPRNIKLNIIITIYIQFKLILNM